MSSELKWMAIGVAAEINCTLETLRVLKSYRKFSCLLTFSAGLGKVQLLTAFLDLE